MVLVHKLHSQPATNKWTKNGNPKSRKNIHTDVIANKGGPWFIDTQIWNMMNQPLYVFLSIKIFKFIQKKIQSVKK